MKKNFIIIIICLSLFGCGSNNGELTTSTVTAKSDIVVLDSDVIKWTDAKTCTGASTPASDSVSVTVTATSYSNSGTLTYPILVKSATITYIPANSATPAMATEYQSLGVRIANGGSASLPIRVANQIQKESLQSSLSCGGPIYKYYTKISLDVEEIGSGSTTVVEVDLDLYLADFVDK